MARTAAEIAVERIAAMRRYMEGRWRGIGDRLLESETKVGKVMRNRESESDQTRNVPTSRLLRYQVCLETAVNEMRINLPALQRENGAWSLIPSPDSMNLLLSWEESPMVLVYDDALANILLEERFDSELQVGDLLSHLPFPCFFVQARGMRFYNPLKCSDTDSDGFFVTETWIPKQGAKRGYEKWLNVSYLVGNLTLALMIPTFGTYGEMMQAIADEAESLYDADEDTIKGQVSDAVVIVNLILYLGAKDAEAGRTVERLLRTGKLQKHGRHQGQSEGRMPCLTTYTVGKGVGDIIGKAVSKDEPLSVGKRKLAAHVRRAHYHTYMEGSRKDSTLHPVRHWVEAVPVNMREKGDGQEPVTRRVRQQANRQSIADLQTGGQKGKDGTRIPCES